MVRRPLRHPQYSKRSHMRKPRGHATTRCDFAIMCAGVETKKMNLRPELCNMICLRCSNVNCLSNPKLGHPTVGILIRFRTRRPPISTSKLTKTTVLDIFAETRTCNFGLDPRPPAYLLFFWGPSEAPNSVCQIQDRGRSRSQRHAKGSPSPAPFFASAFGLG